LEEKGKERKTGGERENGRTGRTPIIISSAHGGKKGRRKKINMYKTYNHWGPSRSPVLSQKIYTNNVII